MKEEKILKERCGKHNAFSVPEGYFDTLSTRITSALPDREPVVMQYSHRPVLRRYMAAAAVALLLICGGGVAFQYLGDADAVIAEQADGDDYIMSDYVMASNEAIYSWMNN